MSHTKIISNSSGTHDVTYYDNDSLQSFTEKEIQKEKQTKDFAFSEYNLCLLLAIDRIQSAIRESNRCLEQEQEMFVGNPTHDIYEQINNIQRETWKLSQKLRELKDELFQKTKVGE